MWTEITRPKYDRTGLRYASDLTDAEWRVIEPHMPPPKALGRPRTTDLRELVNAILYVLRSGCPWRLLPKDFPPRSTVQPRAMRPTSPPRPKGISSLSDRTGRTPSPHSSFPTCSGAEDSPTRHGRVTRPPEATQVWPVMKLAASLSRK